MAVVWRRRRRARAGHGRLRPLGGLARNETGGEGKESNLPSPTRRDRPVLKTGGATGPLPSPLRLTARRWRPATLASRSPVLREDEPRPDRTERPARSQLERADVDRARERPRAGPAEVQVARGERHVGP